MDANTISTPRQAQRVAIWGGGLAGCLCALLWRARFPQDQVEIFENKEQLCGEHTWSFHEADLPASLQDLVRPLISHSWAQQSVQFPRFSRTLNSPYHSIRSEDLRQKTMAARSERFKVHLQSNFSVTTPLPDHWNLIVDSRGWQPLTGPLGYQKFVGWKVILKEAHGLTGPVLMDAKLPQTGGFHFMYLLPWSERELLIEDTTYANSPDLDTVAVEHSITDYLRQRSWQIQEICGKETGCLPLILHEQPEVLPFLIPVQNSDHSCLVYPLGARSGFYHPITGYSLPQTLRSLAWLLENWQAANPPKMIDAAVSHARKNKTRWQYYLFLNRMLFLSATPEKRFEVLQRFYTLPEPLIARFYAGETQWLDSARLLLGRPPVPLLRVWRAFQRNPKMS